MLVYQRVLLQEWKSATMSLPLARWQANTRFQVLRRPHEHCPQSAWPLALGRQTISSSSRQTQTTWTGHFLIWYHWRHLCWSTGLDGDRPGTLRNSRTVGRLPAIKNPNKRHTAPVIQLKYCIIAPWTQRTRDKVERLSCQGLSITLRTQKKKKQLQ